MEFEPATREKGVFVHASRLIQLVSKPAAWASGWTSALLCFSAAVGFWLAGERRKAIAWACLGSVELVAVVF